MFWDNKNLLLTFLWKIQSKNGLLHKINFIIISMDHLTTMYRYLVGSNEGVLGKYKQHAGTFQTNISDAPMANEIFKPSFLQKLDTPPVARHHGSIAHIYCADLNGEKIAIKAVSERHRQIIKQENRVIQSMAYIPFINRSIRQPVRDFGNRMKDEIDMGKELANYRLLQTTSMSRFGIRTVQAIERLCDSDKFVYRYVDASPLESIHRLRETKKNQIINRIVTWILHSNYTHSVMYGDCNAGNFLYHHQTDTIVVLDYGCVIAMTEESDHNLRLVHYNHTPEGTKWLADRYCGGSIHARKLYHEIGQLLNNPEPMDFSKDKSFQHLQNCFKEFNVLRSVEGIRELFAIQRMLALILRLLQNFQVITSFPVINNILPRLTEQQIRERYRHAWGEK